MASPKLMQLSLRALAYTVAAADEGSATLAARRLHVSQPAVSAAIAQLEAQFRLQIFIRHHARGLSPTPAGARFLAAARALLAQAAEFQAGAGVLADALAGEISVGCFLTLAPLVMPGVLAEFQRRHPEIAVRLHDGHQEEILSGLAQGRLELALTYDYGLTGELATELVAELPPHALLAADHPLARNPSLSLEDLTGEPLILLDLPHSRDYFMSLFRTRGLEPRIAFRTPSFEMVRSMVGRRHGFAVMNVIPRAPLTYDGNPVVAIPLCGELAPIRVVTVRPAKTIPRRALEAFQDQLRAYFAAHRGLTGRERTTPEP